MNSFHPHIKQAQRQMLQVTCLTVIPNPFARCLQPNLGRPDFTFSTSFAANIGHLTKFSQLDVWGNW